MPWVELIRILLPLILEMIREKREEGSVTSSAKAVDCWNSPAGRIEMVGNLCIKGVERGLISSEQQLDVIWAAMEQGDNVLMPILIEKIYELSQAA